jgi:hypothetical protein
METTTASPFDHDDERRLEAFGLSTNIIHNALRRGAERAANRTSYALKAAPGTDIYFDGMEDFAQLLGEAGWRKVEVEGQPCLLHPDSLVRFTISSGINVGSADVRSVPRTRRKGPATRHALAPQVPQPMLFEAENLVDESELVARAISAPLYFLLCERSNRGEGVHIEFSRPAAMTNGGSVNQWADRIGVSFLALEGDLSVFDRTDDGPDDEFDVPVEPR